MGLKIGILGTRGIPNQYGGFEKVAEKLSEGLQKKGFDVTVYNSHNHSYQSEEWESVSIVHCFDPEYLLGTVGQFIYDLNCILNSYKKKFDILLFLGYTSSSVWKGLYPKKSIPISNMDGMEWKRSKYSKMVQRYLRYAEKLAVMGSQYHIADSPVIKKYLDKKYQIDSKYIGYGAEIPESISDEILADYDLTKKGYFILVARMEPENNIETILDGFHITSSANKFVVVGNTNNKFGKYLLAKYRNDKRILFTGPLFQEQKLNGLIHYSSLYFHGHSVGGTNPSLLEAMAAGACIVAHANDFNKCILKDNALYFTSHREITSIIHQEIKHKVDCIQNNYTTIRNEYSWDLIIEQYYQFLRLCYDQTACKKMLGRSVYAGSRL